MTKLSVVISFVVTLEFQQKTEHNSIKFEKKEKIKKRESMTETIYSSILNQLLENMDTPRRLAKRKRNIEIIMKFFGISETMEASTLPTLQTLANEFNLTSRERVRQIIEKNFIDRDVPKAIIEVEELIRSLGLVVTGNLLVSALADRCLIDPSNKNNHNGVNLNGIVRTLHAFGRCLDYSAFQNDGKTVRRKDFGVVELSNFSLLHNKVIDKEVTLKVKKKVNLCRKLGLVKEGKLFSPSESAEMSLFFSLGGVLLYSNNGSYFSFTGNRNIIAKMVRRTLIAADFVSGRKEVDLNKLTQRVSTLLVEKSLITKSDVDQVNEVLPQLFNAFSEFELTKENKIRMIQTKGQKISRIEASMLTFFMENPEKKSSFKELSDYFKKSGEIFSVPYIVKTTNHNPYLIKNKSLGRGKFFYHLSDMVY